jgi:hypothetical protein
VQILWTDWYPVLLIGTKFHPHFAYTQIGDETEKYRVKDRVSLRINLKVGIYALWVLSSFSSARWQGVMMVGERLLSIFSQLLNMVAKRVKFEHPLAIVNLTSCLSIQLSIICPSLSLSLCAWPFKGGKKRKEKDRVIAWLTTRTLFFQHLWLKFSAKPKLCSFLCASSKMSVAS